MASDVSSAKLDTIVALCKRRGCVFASGEIYGGSRSAWDYGPLGVELKENIKRQWWKAMVTGREDVVGLGSPLEVEEAVREVERLRIDDRELLLEADREVGRGFECLAGSLQVHRSRGRQAR